MSDLKQTMDLSFTARLTNIMTLFVPYKVVKEDEDLLFSGLQPSQSQAKVTI